jgi:hypothetical protein
MVLSADTLVCGRVVDGTVELPARVEQRQLCDTPRTGLGPYVLCVSRSCVGMGRLLTIKTS